MTDLANSIERAKKLFSQKGIAAASGRILNPAAMVKALIG